MQKAATLMWKDCGLAILLNYSGDQRRFPPLVLSTLGSRNIEYLFEYSEVGGLHYQLSA
jgi:hypothetical protein